METKDLTADEFKTELENFWKWVNPNRSRSRLSWYLSLENYSNRMYDKTYKKETKL